LRTTAPRAGGSSHRRPRLLLSLSVAALASVVGLTMLPGSADAKPTPGPGADDGEGISAQRLEKYEAGRYIVMLSAPPAAAHPETRVSGGDSFDARSAEVRSYAAKLERSHGSLASDLGFTVEQDYTIASNGFTANLTAEQAEELASDRRVLFVEKAATVEADTWNTPKQLGLTGKNGVWEQTTGRKSAGDGVVIGIIDSGIWPENKSFAGAPLTSAPKTKWDISMSDDGSTRMEKSDGGVFNGVCETGEEWTTDLCNTKLIGARYYVEGYGSADVLEEDYLSPRDGNGHGSHTASTAAGNIVKKITVEGRRFGTISGMAPGARISVYKALWATPAGTASGNTADLVAAIDDAVADGVDVINYSISGAQDTVVDAVEFAFEGAAEAGVFVATSAGNDGPDASTVGKNAPWETTVAASTHFAAENTVVLGNGKKVVGASIAGEGVPESPLVSSADAAVEGGVDADLCGPDSLDPDVVEGAIVVCLRGNYDRVAKSAEVARAGGVGMILANPSPNSLDADFHSVPTVHIDEKAAAKVFAYLEEAGDDATAEIKVGNLTNHVTPVPQVAGFSSRGPALSDEGDILKPDIAAPGSSVLAAVAPPSNSDRDYDLYSGTSMASPHIAGLAGFMQGLHPRWTPMQIKSAMMTSAGDLLDEKGERATDLFAEGAGLVRPKQMLDPGLFVTSGPQEWYAYLAGLGVDTGEEPIAANQVNIPSMAESNVLTSTSFTRRFTSTRAGTWKVKVSVPGFEGTSSSSTVVAKRARDIEQLTFDFTRTDAPLGEWQFGYVTLSGPTRVRMPVALRPVSVQAPSSVGGEGTEGAVEVPITGGFDGELDVTPAGLVKGQVFEGDVPEGESVFDCVTIGEGNELAQLDLHAPDPTSDLDMFVYAVDSCESEEGDLVLQAATPSAGETLTVEGMPAGTYVIETNAFAAGEQGDPVPYSLRVYDLGGSPEVGDLTATPDPVPVQTAQETSFELSWSGLEAEAHYFGVVSYQGSPDATFVYVDTTGEEEPTDPEPTEEPTEEPTATP